MKINIASNELIHFIGIGGIGMSGLAQIMTNMGFQIQGSDLNDNKNIGPRNRVWIFWICREQSLPLEIAIARLLQYALPEDSPGHPQQWYRWDL